MEDNIFIFYIYFLRKKKSWMSWEKEKSKEKKNIYYKKAASHGTHMDSLLSIKVGYKFLKYEKKKS